MFANTVLFHVFISEIRCHEILFLPNIQFQQPPVTSVTKNAMVLPLNAERVSEGAWEKLILCEGLSQIQTVC